MKLEGFTPLADRVLVRPNKGETKTGTGLVLVENSDAPCFGDVIAVSPQRNEHGKALVPFDANEVIAYPRGAGKPIYINGETMLILRTSEIIAVVTPAKE